MFDRNDIYDIKTRLSGKIISADVDLFLNLHVRGRENPYDRPFVENCRCLPPGWSLYKNPLVMNGRVQSIHIYMNNSFRNRINFYTAEVYPPIAHQMLISGVIQRHTGNTQVLKSKIQELWCFRSRYASTLHVCYWRCTEIYNWFCSGVRFIIDLHAPLHTVHI